MTGASKRRRHAAKKVKNQVPGLSKIAHQSAALSALDMLEVLAEDGFMSNEIPRVSHTYPIPD